MHVQVGPLPSEGVSLWIAYARTVLGQLQAGTSPGGPIPLEPAVVDAFEQFLDDWDRTARRGPEFVWIAEVDPEQIEFLAYAFHNVATRLAAAAETRGYPLAPPEGEEFYLALVTSFLDALEQEGKVTAAFAEEIRGTWPGLKPA
jgi:hypothetical protein